MTSEDAPAEAGEIGENVERSVVDLLSWLLDTETRARIYVALRRYPHTTSQEIADETGLYPSTVREALAELHEDGTVTRRKRETSGAGNNPYEYEAIAPATLVEGVVGQVQTELNTVFNLDRHLGTDAGTETNPVTVSVEAADAEGRSAEESSAETEPADSHESPDGSDGLDMDGGLVDANDET